MIFLGLARAASATRTRRRPSQQRGRPGVQRGVIGMTPVPAIVCATVPGRPFGHPGSDMPSRSSVTAARDSGSPPLNPHFRATARDPPASHDDPQTCTDTFDVPSRALRPGTRGSPVLWLDPSDSTKSIALQEVSGLALVVVAVGVALPLVMMTKFS